MAKLDLKKEMRDLFSPPRDRVVIVEVPTLSYLMADGTGDPNTSLEYQDAMTALYGVSYALKFALKAEGSDYTVMPLEGLWWMADESPFDMQAKSAWAWTSMIMQPDFVTPSHVEDAVARSREKRPSPAYDLLRFEELTEGPSAQTMHIGPYAEEAPTIARLHEFIESEGYVPRGRHHEIYLGDPRRTKPENLKTVIRQPVEPA